MLKEQSDQGLHCLPFHLHLSDTLLLCKTELFLFRMKTEFILGVPIFEIFMVCTIYAEL